MIMTSTLLSLLVALSTQGVHVGRPPVELATTQNRDRIEKLYARNYVGGIAKYLMHEKAIQVHYSLHVNGPREDALDTSLFSEVVSYWPTAVAVLGEQVLGVAGKRQTRTVIEIWKIRPSPPILSVVGSPGTSFSGEPIDQPGVRRKTTVYDEAEAGKDMVKWMVLNRGKPNSLFVQFFDSGDLYELDYSEAITPSQPPPPDPYPLTPVLSATAGGAVPHAPELDNVDLRWVESRHHEAEGYCYVVIAPFEVQWEVEPDILAFWMFDHDLDGQLDEWTTLAAAQEQTRGLLDDDPYTDRGQKTLWGHN